LFNIFHKEYEMRSVRILIGGKSIGRQRTWAYPEGTGLGEYWIPIYQCTVSGTDSESRTRRGTFSVLRFGVQCKDRKTAKVVGLADYQQHTIKAWLPQYGVHSDRSHRPSDPLKIGAWQVKDDFLIHDGPDDSKELFATIGCIEIMGFRGFELFNDLIIALAGPTSLSRSQQLREIGNSGRLFITYEKATRPALIRKD
jgi:hypothetical protein